MRKQFRKPEKTRGKTGRFPTTHNREGRTGVMRLMRVALPLLALLAACQAAPPRLRALIVEGQSNHADWPLQTRMVREGLEQSGLFTVDVATAPPKGSDLSSFRPRFADYSVVLSLYNGASWPGETRGDFDRYVREGGGFVSIHMADNSFPDWPGYNRMIGLGGWAGRDERSGPYAYIEGDRLVRDPSPGPGGSHGVEHRFRVVVRDPDHPVTRGLPPVWTHERDELYDRLRGPAEGMSVLATAQSDRATGGSGREEPVLLTISYGKGRVFHTTLGHGPYSRECVGFIVTLQRGAEWAATGDVTQRVPSDFPAGDAVRRRPFREHPEGILCLDFSPDGSLLASGGEDGAVRIWDPRGTKPIRTLEGHTGPVTSLAFSPDGTTLVSSGRTVRMWDVGRGREKGSPDAGPWAESVAISPEGDRLAVGGANPGLWSLKDGRRLAAWTGWVRRVAFSPDGRTAGAACADGTFRRWASDGAGEPVTLRADAAPLDALAFGSDGKVAATGGRDGIVRLWDVASGDCLRQMVPKSGWINDVAFSPDGRLLAAGHGRLTFWDVLTGAKLAELPAPGGRVTALAFSPDGKSIAFAGPLSVVAVRDLAELLPPPARR
jgi:uncharacterized protein